MALFRTSIPATQLDLARRTVGEKAVAGTRVELLLGGAEPRENVRIEDLPVRWALATAHHVIIEREDAPLVRRWCDVDHAAVDAQANVMTISWADGTTPTRLHLVDRAPQAFARTLRERVVASVVHRETAEVPGGGTVRVAIRRDENDELFSEVLGDGYLDLTDPATRAVVQATEARVRSAVGLPL
ncbi:hypothetical protein ACTVCO_10995 [Sanguibacter sp. A247]|uniref:hypothetical protein n=1 Tax=unclassified Sanguibacter TaxID=2645534 RepID=UPI003FD7B1C2